MKFQKRNAAILEAGVQLRACSSFAAAGVQHRLGRAAQAPEAQACQFGHAYAHGRGGGNDDERCNADLGAFAHQFMAAAAGQHHKTGLAQSAGAGEAANQFVQCVVAAHVLQHIGDLAIQRGPACGVNGTGFSIQQLMRRQGINRLENRGCINALQPVPKKTKGRI